MNNSKLLEGPIKQPSFSFHQNSSPAPSTAPMSRHDTSITLKFLPAQDTNDSALNCSAMTGD